jgi:hypothetical protein
VGAQVPRRIVTDSLAVIDALPPTIQRLDGEVHARRPTREPRC